MGHLAYFQKRPLAILTTGATTGPAPLTIRFNGSGSGGPLHTVSSWILNFGDGSPLATGSGAPPVSVQHAYAAGTYTAALTVRDPAGQTDLTSVTVTAYPPPFVKTGWARVVSPTARHLDGFVRPNGLDTSYQFQWGTSAAFRYRSAFIGIGGGTARVKVATKLTGLSPRTVYYWRLVARNAAGMSVGATKSFKVYAGAAA
jgi:hypothetical protein